MATLLGIDLETTGLDPEKDHITEIGMVLWDTERNTPVETYSTLVKTDKILDNKIKQITGLDDELLDQWGSSIDAVAPHIKAFSREADYIVAHNAPFEKGLLTALTKKELMQPVEIPWVDTKTDIPYLPGKGEGTLTLIAANHGFLNPFAHRALFDVMTMLKVLSLYPFKEIERYALSENITLSISFPFDETGKKNALVRELGYYWTPQVKQWRKNIKEFQLEEFLQRAKEAGFKPNILHKDEAS